MLIFEHMYHGFHTLQHPCYVQSGSCDSCDSCTAFCGSTLHCYCAFDNDLLTVFRGYVPITMNGLQHAT